MIEASGVRVSFIVPSLNQGRFIGQCLNSIAAQGLPRETCEVWVIDGGSTDETLEVLENHPLHPQWISEPDRGHWDAVNKGIRCSCGEILCWINSDDVYLPGGVKEALAFFEAHPECAILYGEADYIDESGARIGSYQVEDWDYERLADKCYLCQPAVLFRRSVVEKHGLLSGDYPVALDLEYWMRIGQTTVPQRVPIKIAASRLWGGTKSSREQWQMQRDALAIGHRYTERWSRRRKWSVAEQQLLSFLPGFRGHRKWTGWRQWALVPFWGLKTLFYGVLSVRCWLMAKGRIVVRPCNKAWRCFVKGS